MDMNERLTDVTRTAKMSTSLDMDAKKSGESVECFLKVNFSNTTVEHLLADAMAQEKIRVQAQLRRKGVKVEPNSTIEVDYKAPASKVISTDDALRALGFNPDNMTTDEKERIIETIRSMQAEGN